MWKLSFHFVIFRLRLRIITFCNLFINFHDLIIIYKSRICFVDIWYVVFSESNCFHIKNILNHAERFSTVTDSSSEWHSELQSQTQTISL